MVTTTPIVNTRAFAWFVTTRPKELPPHDYDGRLFHCRKCGHHNVAASAEGRLKHLTLEERKAALAKANRSARNGQVPTVTTLCF